MASQNRISDWTRTLALALGLVLVVGVAIPGCKNRRNKKPNEQPIEVVDVTQPAEPKPQAAKRKRPSMIATSGGRARRAMQRGDELYDAGEHAQALAEFERAIAINPELTTAYIRAGDIHREQRDYNSAEVNYRKAAQLEPRNFDAQYLHGLVLQLLNRLDEAVRSYLRALAVRPNDFEANMNLGTTYLQLGEPAQALAYSQRAVRINPDSGPARVNLGAVYAELDRHDAAVIEYQQAAELLPTPDEKLLLNLADSLGRVQRYAEMSATLDQLVRIKPSAMAYERMGSALFRQKQYDDALAAFRRSSDMDQKHYPAFNGVAVCRLNQYVWSGKTDSAALDDALRALRSSLQIERRQPKIVELLRRYGPAGASATG